MYLDGRDFLTTGGKRLNMYIAEQFSNIATEENFCIHYYFTLILTKHESAMQEKGTFMSCP